MTEYKYPILNNAEELIEFLAVREFEGDAFRPFAGQAHTFSGDVVKHKS